MPAPIAKLSLQNYLGSTELTEHLKLTNELSFHWANWDQTCIVQRKFYKNFNHNYHLVRLNQSLQELKNKPIWLCNKIKVLKTDLYSLYESYLDSRLRLTWFERKDEILFSFEGEQGPYYTLTSMKWLDGEIYSKFVMRKILLEQCPLRSFRLNSTIPILFKLNNDVNEYSEKVMIHQLSEVGFIFKVKDKNFLNKIKNSTQLELKIPVENYKKIGHLDIESALDRLSSSKKALKNEFVHFSLESRILNFYGNLTNAKRSSEEEFFIFARYEDLVPVGHELELKTIFAPLVEKTKMHFVKNLASLDLTVKEKKSA